MESSPTPPDKKTSRCSPLLVFVIAAVIVLSIAAFLIFHPTPPGTNQKSTSSPASQQ